jgi:hypothetical protein
MSSTDGDMGEITENDIDDTKKYIMSFLHRTKLVRFDDACLRRIDFDECLFPDDGWLDGDVSIHFHIYVYCKSMCSSNATICVELQCITAYIYCLRVKEHLATRAGGKVWLENTHVSNLMKHMGANPISVKDPATIIKRVHNYLKHDMVSSAYLFDFNLNIDIIFYHLLFYLSSAIYTHSCKYESLDPM